VVFGSAANAASVKEKTSVSLPTADFGDAVFQALAEPGRNW
jgi:hypothetical protein